MQWNKMNLKLHTTSRWERTSYNPNLPAFNSEIRWEILPLCQAHELSTAPGYNNGTKQILLKF